MFLARLAFLVPPRPTPWLPSIAIELDLWDAIEQQTADVAPEAKIRLRLVDRDKELPGLASF